MARRNNRRNPPADDAVPAAENNHHEGGGGETRRVADHVRERQRAVAEREAARLARPERRRVKSLEHSKKSSVSSTPFGRHRTSAATQAETSSEEWCGPWSVARQMIAKREQARRERQEEMDEETKEHHPLDQAMEDLEQETQKKIHPSMNWKGELPKNRPSSLYAKRQKRMDQTQQKNLIPSLYDLCVNFVVDNFEYVESLGDVDNDVRVSISKQLVARNQLDAQALETLTEPFLETLELIDCAGIPQDILAAKLKELKQLRYLFLTHAGRCFGPKSVESLIASQPQPQLVSLSVSGAYLLSDVDAARLIRANKSSLQSLEFQVCPNLGVETCKAIAEVCPTLLELSMKELTLSGDSLTMLASASWTNLSSLSLISMAGLSDKLVMGWLEKAGDTLENLTLAENYDLSDAILSSIRQFNTSLKRLDLSKCKELTAGGLETLFTYDLPGLPHPPKLKSLFLGSVDYQAVTDDVMELVTASATHNNDASKSGIDYLAKRPAKNTSSSGGLVQLDLHGSTLVTDATMEHLAATSAYTLRELNVSYCPLITDKGLGYLVDQCGRQLSKITLWGCAQLTDEFYDGHARTNDPSLEIVGAWMKKSGSRSLR